MPSRAVVVTTTIAALLKIALFCWPFYLWKLDIPFLRKRDLSSIWIFSNCYPEVLYRKAVSTDSLHVAQPVIISDFGTVSARDLNLCQEEYSAYYWGGGLLTS